MALSSSLAFARYRSIQAFHDPYRVSQSGTINTSLASHPEIKAANAAETVTSLRYGQFHHQRHMIQEI